MKQELESKCSELGNKVKNLFYPRGRERFLEILRKVEIYSDLGGSALVLTEPFIHNFEIMLVGLAGCVVGLSTWGVSSIIKRTGRSKAAVGEKILVPNLNIRVS